MEKQESWKGSPTELHNELDRIADGLYVDKKSNTWAKTPRTLGKKIRLIIPNLREEGIMVKIHRISAGQEYHIVNRLYSETKTTQTTQTTQHSGFDANSKLHETTLTTRQTTPADEDVVSQTTQNDQTTCKIHPQKQQQEGSNVVSVDNVVSAPTLMTTGACGKCGCKLSGQTFQGPAGLGMICADCQADLDRERGFGDAPPS